MDGSEDGCPAVVSSSSADESSSRRLPSRSRLLSVFHHDDTYLRSEGALSRDRRGHLDAGMSPRGALRGGGMTDKHGAGYEINRSCYATCGAGVSSTCVTDGMKSVTIPTRGAEGVPSKTDFTGRYCAFEEFLSIVISKFSTARRWNTECRPGDNGERK